MNCVRGTDQNKSLYKVAISATPALLNGMSASAVDFPSPTS